MTPAEQHECDVVRMSKEADPAMHGTMNMGRMLIRRCRSLGAVRLTTRKRLLRRALLPTIRQEPGSGLVRVTKLGLG